MRTFTCLAMTVVFLVVSSPAVGARTKVYRCVSDSGHVSYQQFPCHNNDTPVKLRDSHSGWSSLRPGEKALLNDYRKEAAKRQRRPAAPKQQESEETVACWNKRRQLAALRARLRRGYRLDEGDALRRKRNDYADYLRQFCS